MAKLRFLPVIAAFCLLVSCGESEAAPDMSNVSKTRDLFAMDTYMNLKAYGERADIALDAAQQRIIALEDTLSVTNESSDVSRINSAAGTPVSVSEDTAAIIAAGLEYGGRTDGCLDITLYPVLRAWGFTTGDYRIPEPSELSALLEKVDYSKVTLEGDSVTIPEGSSIDLGALAKGFTSDSVMEIFAENGVTSGIISLGGNVQALGTKPDGSPWKVAVRDPFSTTKDMCVVSIEDKAVITSGNYERFFTGEDGRNYWHIMDASDGYPADNGLVSVTVIGDCGLECDALSTALFVAGKDGACDYWKSHPDIDLILVTDQSEILYTPGIADTFQNVSQMKAEVMGGD